MLTKEEWKKKYEYVRPETDTHPGDCCGVNCFRCLTCAVVAIVPLGKGPCDHKTCRKSRVVFEQATFIHIAINDHT